MSKATVVDTSAVSVPRGWHLSKTKAVMLIRRYFRDARIMNVTTPADVKNGVERWQVWCLSDYAKQTPVVEVCGPVDHLPKAALVGACERVGLSVEFSDPGGKRAVRIGPKAATPTPAEAQPEPD